MRRTEAQVYALEQVGATPSLQIAARWGISLGGPANAPGGEARVLSTSRLTRHGKWLNL